MSVASTHIFSQNLYCSTKFVAFLEIPFCLAHVGILSHLVQILQPFKLMWTSGTKVSVKRKSRFHPDDVMHISIVA